MTAISSVRLRPAARTNDQTNKTQPARNKARLTANPSHASESGATTPSTAPTPNTMVPAHEARTMALPFFPQLEAEDQERVVEALRGALG